MNIKMKALVAAAVAAMSVSGAANAALTTGNTGSSSLVLAVWDTTNNISAVFDLGFDYEGFSFGSAGSSSSYSWDVSSGDYADAWNALGGNLVWGVVATDYNGSINEAGSLGWISTFKDGQNLAAPLRMAQIGRPLAVFDEYLVDNNRKGNVADAGKAYAGSLFTGNKIFNLGPQVLDAVGNEQGVVQYYSAVGSLGVLTYVQYDATFKLDANGLLTYTVAAVPEPETYALLLAGLGLVGAAARRRKSA